MALRILIVDDDDFVLDSLVEISKEMGHQVMGCTRATIAKDLLKDLSFDLLITDLQLPGMSGVDLAKHAAVYSEMEVVVTSGHLKPDDLPDGVGWLQKPFGMSEYERLLMAHSRPVNVVELVPAEKQTTNSRLTFGVALAPVNLQPSLPSA